MAINTSYYVKCGANYPRQHWWVVGTSEEFSRERILGRRILEIPMAFYRTQNGEIVALEDYCPHRAAPLSFGALEGDNLVCGYHGMRFSPDGKCIKVPTQDKIPRAAKVRSYPVVEKAPFVWVWTGDPDKADRSVVPEYFWLNSPDWAFALNYIHLNCNYLMLKENVIDLTHFAYVHASSFEMGDDYGEPPECILENGSVAFRQEFKQAPLPGFWDQGIGLNGKIVDRVDTGTSLSPAEHVYTQEVDNPDPGPGQREHYSFRFQHMTTPETPTSHHYWWVMARDHGLGPEGEKWMMDTVNAGFEEDRVLLEGLQDQINRCTFPETVAEVSLLADEVSLNVRRQVDDLLAQEQGGE